jgi:ferredoxin
MTRECVEACPFGVVALLPNEHKKKEGFFAKVLGLARSAPPKTITGHVASDPIRCVQCGVCGYNCPEGIQVRDYARQGKVVDDPGCTRCGLCIAVCPRGTLRWDIAPQVPAPVFHADKCNLCDGYAESACVKECPATRPSATRGSTPIMKAPTARAATATLATIMVSPTARRVMPRMVRGARAVAAVMVAGAVMVEAAGAVTTDRGLHSDLKTCRSNVAAHRKRASPSWGKPVFAFSKAKCAFYAPDR